MLSILAVIGVFFRSRADTALEVLALRQQLAVLKRKRPRPALHFLDRLFWTTLRRFWPRWIDVLVIVQPKTVIAWHRAGSRLYWRWRSRPRGGRPKITEEIRVLIRRLAEENPGWGAPKIHGELQKLGILVSERSVARYLRPIQRRGNPGKQWLTFLHNHREVIVAFDFFTVPTLTFQLLYANPLQKLYLRRGPYGADFALALRAVRRAGSPKRDFPQPQRLGRKRTFYANALVLGVSLIFR